MLAIHVIRGLQGSGKTTKAIAMVNSAGGGVARVNKDEIRRTLWGNLPYSKEREEVVRTVQIKAINAALGCDKSVVIDDTGSLKPVTLETYRRIAQDWGIELIVDDSLLSVPLETCIRQDLQRPHSVGADVIRKWHHLYIGYKPAEINPALPHCAVFDVDGCLAQMADREVYDWSQAHRDSVIEPIANLLNNYGSNPDGFPANETFILTGREGTPENRKIMLDWLEDNRLIHSGDKFLIMREPDDRRPAAEYKREAYLRIQAEFNIDYAVDNDPTVIAVANELGISTVQPNFLKQKTSESS